MGFEPTTFHTPDLNRDALTQSEVTVHLLDLGINPLQIHRQDLLVDGLKKGEIGRMEVRRGGGRMKGRKGGRGGGRKNTR